MEKANIKKLAWRDVSKKVAHVNPKLAKIIDELDPDENFPVYLARYPYGSQIVRDGNFNLPTANGDIVPIEDSSIDAKTRTDLTYLGTGMPAGIVLTNTAHESVTTTHQILPLGVIRPGSIFELWKKLDSEAAFHPIKMFTVTAGARFICMLPNISDISLHKNLKRDFNVRLPPPKSLLDHWEIFKTIVYHPATKCDWATELLFFSGAWFEKIKNDHAWRALHLFFLQTAWEKTSYERNKMFYDLAFSRAQANRNLKPNPYLVDTAKHLFMVGAGIAPGFSVAVDNLCAPIEALHKVYLTSYGLKQYNPTVFLPRMFNLTNPDERPVYYSLQMPTTLEFSPKSRKISSTLHDLSELKHVMSIFTDEIMQGNLKAEDTIIGRIASEAEFDFFHNKVDRHGEIKLTQEMHSDDNDLTHCHHKEKNREFADSGTLIRGCVRISKKKIF